MNENIEIQHRPHGDRHPYENSVDERIPRSPISTDIVKIGILTRPVGAVKKVSIKYWTDNNRENKEYEQAAFEISDFNDIDITEEGHLSEAAARAGVILDVDQWKVNIPEYPPGTKVYYQISAESEGNEVESQIYSYTVRKRVVLNEIVNIFQGIEFVIFVLENSEEKKSGYLKITIEENDCIRMIAGLGKYSLSEEKYSSKPELQKEDSKLISLGSYKLQVRLNPFQLEILNNNDLIISGISTLEFIFGDDDNVEKILLSFLSPDEESFYGFGERFNSLNQRGQKIDIRVYEQYKNHGLRTYLPMPLFISSLGYGMLLESLRYSSFDLAKENKGNWKLEAEVGEENLLSLVIVLGNKNNLLDIVSRLNILTGRPVLPPNWAFGLWISSNEWNSQAKVEEIIYQNESHQIPVSVMVLEAWSDENTFYIWNESKYSPQAGNESFQLSDFDFPKSGLWPDPKGMVEKLHSLGMYVLLWQIPILKENEENHPQLENDKNFMVEKDYCVRTDKNEPYLVRPFWFKGGLLMDFTSPEGVDWWMKKREYLLNDIGIDGFKTDGGEHIWGRDLVFSDGRKSDELWNEYPNLYAEAYYTLAKKYNDGGITFSRAGYTGAQAFPCHWAGDENSTWEAFQRSILAGLNAGISGVAFWGWDFAGFSGDIPTAELYLRAAAMATFSPIMQYHSEYNHHQKPLNDRTPWNIAKRTNNPSVLKVFKFYANLRMNLLPYILQTARSSSKTGLPMMRSLSIMYPHDQKTNKYLYEYMFGDNFLIAPIVEPDKLEIEVYLPEGEWISFWDDKKYSGSEIYSIPTKLDEIPAFIRENSLIPFNLNEDYRIGGNVGNNTHAFNNLSFVFYPGPEGKYYWNYDKTGEEIEFYWKQKSSESFVLKIENTYHPINIIIPSEYIFDQDFEILENGKKVLSLPINTEDNFELIVYKK
jgi:alpha-D-xyloside xylohydrolase